MAKISVTGTDITVIQVDIDDYTREEECIYKDERYSARDNGAVYRHPREGKKPRPTDCQWTFGKPNDKTRYMEIGSARVHIIVATAFHGVRDTKIYVVDHIDTNRRNNRLENLRWLTRLENVLLNPISKAKIEWICGCTAEEFLANPEKYRDLILPDTGFGWMRTVTKEEGDQCLKNMLEWVASGKKPSGGTMGEWIFQSRIPVRPKTETDRIANEQVLGSRIDMKIEEIFRRVEIETGLSREELSSKTKKRDYLVARVHAANLLRSELNLSEERISQLIGISTGMVNSYLNHPDSYLKDTKFYGDYGNHRAVIYPQSMYDEPMPEPLTKRHREV
jgi:hypothetical protein